MPDSTEETDVGHAGWISGCVLLSCFYLLHFFKVEEEGTRKGTGSPWMDSSLFSFSLILNKRREKSGIHP